MSSSRHAHRTPPRFGVATPRVLAAAASLALLVLLGATLTRIAFGSNETTASCGQQLPQLRVAAAPAIAPVVAALGHDLLGGSAAPDCFDVAVRSVDARAEIQSLADGATRPPDVWIPDSTLWIDRAGVERVAKATNAASVASSPLVIAVPSREADRLRGTGMTETMPRPTVADLAVATAQGDPFTIELSDQKLSPTRVGTILALTEATRGTPDARASLTALLRSARVTTDPTTTRLTSLSPTASVGVPASEHDVWAARHDSSSARPVAIYTGGGGFDFPYAVLTTDPATTQRAQRLFDLLTSAPGQSRLKASGLRDVNGVGGPALAADRGVDGTTKITPAPLSPPSLAQAEKVLATSTQDARLLAVMDISGSMAWGVGGRDTAGPSRLAIATRAAATGLGLYPPSTEVGFWVFSKDIAGSRDYREVAPVTRLDAPGFRSALTSALTQAAPTPGGDTALYATTLAAVRQMGTHWQPGRVNAVVLLSDGKNTDTDGPTLSHVVSALEAQGRSSTPVPVITIAFGPQGDAVSLAAISKASGGATYRASTADQVRQIFLDAVGQRACRPNCT
ncbi:substrate-binding domain-containing protein [Humibacillus sp. DSM 29435]|uniref:substrate-binding domain-containing protein n=1 Tax=Humibacillus sp. DSM 29435 TaxID=1869167 RepID=UPI00111313BB|nr:substrate-binding domain-containing protein [Humibacillus sp. DSM 29435]